MFDEPIVFVDIETNGSSVNKGRIIEIAAIRVEEGKITDSFTSLVNPGNPIPYWITNLTGIHNSDLVHAPYFDEIAEQLKNILEGAIFAAHHVRFDYSFIKNHFKMTGFDYKPKLFCTVRLSRALYPELKGHSLEKIINRHGITVDARHRAYADAKAIWDFTKLAYNEKGDEAFQAAKLKQFKTRTLPPNFDEKYLENVTDKPGVYIFENEHGTPVYIGKSVTLRSRIMSHFSQDTTLNKEMKLSLATHRLRVIETNSELEALLLESKLVKELLPIHNRKLRRVKSHFVLLKGENETGYTTITIGDKDVSKDVDLENIYGMYASRAKAKSALDIKQRTYQICPKLLGLEKTKGACFQYQLGKCRGACIGKEPAESHNQRVDIALERTRIESWPFKSPIAISAGSGNHIVIDKWIVQGYINSVEAGEPDFVKTERTFDLDTYRILRAYISKNMKNLTIQPFSYT